VAEFSKHFYGDYYPLTPYSRESNVWVAWQFNLPEAEEGAVQIFRRNDAFHDIENFKLHGLEPDADYELTDLDTGKTFIKNSRKLMETGLEVKIPDAPGLYC